ADRRADSSRPTVLRPDDFRGVRGRHEPVRARHWHPPGAGPLLPGRGHAILSSVAAVVFNTWLIISARCRTALTTTTARTLPHAMDSTIKTYGESGRRNAAC